MKSFLITFKPQTESPLRGWPMTSLQRLARLLREKGRLSEPWRFLNRKDRSPGDRVFLLLQGSLGPAIIGYGKTAREQGREWRQIEFDSLVNPEEFVLLNRPELSRIRGGSKWWRTQASGVCLPDHIASQLEKLVVGGRPKATNSVLPINKRAIRGSVSEGFEGRLSLQSHLRRERDRRLVEGKRNQALVKYGKLFCEVCNSDFATLYGSLCSGVIECHHKKFVSSLGRGGTINLQDLALVCANCHRVLHRGGHTIRSLKKLVMSKKPR